MAALVVVRVVGTRWGHERRWEAAAGDHARMHAYLVLPFARVLDAVLIVSVVAAAALGAWLVRLYRREGELRPLIYGAAVACALATAELLKEVLPARGDASTRFAFGYPSGHTTLAAGTALAFLLVAPARAWALPAGSAFAAFVAEGVVVDGWHLPSDAVGGLALAFAWICVAIAVAPPDGLRPTRGDALRAVAAWAAVTALIVSQAGVDGRLRLPATAALATLAIGVLALVVVAAVVAQRARLRATR